MTTKKQLIDKIAELQAQVDAMPDDKPYLDTGLTYCDGGGVSRSLEASEDYEKAFNVIEQLHALSDWDGAGDDNGIKFYHLYFGIGSCSSLLSIDHHHEIGMWSIFGAFNSPESLRNAIETIGKDNIIEAYKVLILRKAEERGTDR